jgi:hypothetical protein
MNKGYEVGYGNPPLHTRFVKGKSGNPKGRPPKEFYGHRIHRRHIRDDIERLLVLRIPAPEAGRTKRITVQRAMIRGLVNRAIDGHASSMHQIWMLIRHFGVDKEPEKDIQYYRRTPSDEKRMDKALRELEKLGDALEHGTPYIEDPDDWDDLAPNEDERPPKRPNLMDDLLLELQEPVTIIERGKRKRITKQEALLRTLLAQSTRSVGTYKLFWAIFRHYALDKEPDKYLVCDGWVPHVAEEFFARTLPGWSSEGETAPEAPVGG